MIPEIGHFALVLAFVLAAVQGTVPLFGAARNDLRLMAMAPAAAVGQLLFVGLAFGCLTAAYVTSDFSVLNVAMNSHTAKPFLYKITGVWGNHEGSILLWILILAVFGAAVALFGRNLPDSLRARVLSVQALIAVGFLAFSLFTSNPFERLSPAPAEGNGLNPILQDPGLAFHPPFLYLGYVGFSIAFSFALAALIEGRLDASWGRWVRPWTLAAWSFLTIGIALGSWWAYYELGWGGWWFWDPVENASFMPWLAGTALLHSVIVVEKRDALKSWTVLLAILTFSLSLLGTFLVRSGVLVSVHAFANDPSRGVFILGFLILVVGGSLALYAVRAPTLRAGGLFAPISREGALLLNNFLLAVAAATVLLGTLYPLFLDALTGEKISVGPPYFNATFAPLMTPLILAMAVGPMLPWKRGDLGAALARLKGVAAITALVVIATAVLRDGASWLAVLGLGLATWLLLGTIAQWAERVRLFRAPLRETIGRAGGLPRAAYGMTVAHLGMAVCLFGITASGAWEVEKLQIMSPGETVRVGAFDYRFDGVREVDGPNYTADRGRFTVTRAGETVTVLHPEARRYPNPPMETTEAGIYTMLGGDLYAVIGEAKQNGAWSTRLYFKPLVAWIWGGAILMALGGFISLSDRRLRVGVARRPARTTAPEPAQA